MTGTSEHSAAFWMPSDVRDSRHPAFAAVLQGSMVTPRIASLAPLSPDPGAAERAPALEGAFLAQESARRSLWRSGVSGLLGWAIHVPILTRWVPGYVTLKVNTGTMPGSWGRGRCSCIVARMARQNAGKLAWVCAALLLAISGPVVGRSTFFARNFRHRRVADAGHDPWAVARRIPGRMAPNTALALVTLGIALRASRSASRRTLIAWRKASAFRHACSS